MKQISTFLFVSVFSVSLFASNEYYSRHKIEFKDTSAGEWSIEYIQLEPSSGKELTAEQIEVNRLLKSSAEELVPDAYAISNGESYAYSSTVVTFLSPRLLAIDVNYDYYHAGTPHPNFGIRSSIFDLKLGKEIALSTGLPLGEYQQKIESPDFISLVTERLIQAARDSKDLLDECKGHYNESSLDNLINISLSPRDITVQPSFQQAIKGCEISVTIPMIELKSVAKPGSLLEELIEGAK